jgi:DNA-binding GntR family transcriptional regulator
MSETLKSVAKNNPHQFELRNWLEEQILSGQIKPGDRINEKDLCERFSVSRTPVREAILQLTTAGLITVRPRQGAIVTRMSVKQVAAMWEVLAGLEAQCAELAATRMSLEDRDKLIKIHETAGNVLNDSTVERYDAANAAFHDLIYSASQNEYLGRLVRDLRKRLQPYRRLPFQRAGGMKRSFDGHDRIVQAILAGDSRAAAEEMRSHVTGGLTFLDFIAEMPDDFEV